MKHSSVRSERNIYLKNDPDDGESEDEYVADDEPVDPPDRVEWWVREEE